MLLFNTANVNEYFQDVTETVANQSKVRSHCIGGHIKALQRRREGWDGHYCRRHGCCTAATDAPPPLMHRRH